MDYLYWVVAPGMPMEHPHQDLARAQELAFALHGKVIAVKADVSFDYSTNLLSLPDESRTD
jgi:hypothetical protein